MVEEDHSPSLLGPPSAQLSARDLDGVRSSRSQCQADAADEERMLMQERLGALERRMAVMEWAAGASGAYASPSSPPLEPWAEGGHGPHAPPGGRGRASHRGWAEQQISPEAPPLPDALSRRRRSVDTDTPSAMYAPAGRVASASLADSSILGRIPARDTSLATMSWGASAPRASALRPPPHRCP